MSKELEQFVHDHRDEFDTDEPGKDVWEKVRRGMEPPRKGQAIVLRLTRASLSAAAVLLLLVAGLVWWLNTRHKTDAPVAASPAAGAPEAQQQAPSPVKPGLSPDSPATASLAATPPADVDTSPSSEEEASAINEEMYHYVRLVELKQKELKHLEKDEPLLYLQFSADLHKLDSVYNSLQKRLSTTPNREQLLEAMLQDLQLQMKLLNHQLNIIKQIDHSKKSAYDSAYKTL